MPSTYGIFSQVRCLSLSCIFISILFYFSPEDSY